MNEHNPTDLTLEVMFHDDANGADPTSLMPAYISRPSNDVLVQCDEPSIKVALEALADTGRYSMADDTLTILRALAHDLPNAVNGFSRKSFRIRPAS